MTKKLAARVATLEGRIKRLEAEIKDMRENPPPARTFEISAQTLHLFGDANSPRSSE